MLRILGKDPAMKTKDFRIIIAILIVVFVGIILAILEISASQPSFVRLEGTVIKHCYTKEKVTHEYINGEWVDVYHPEEWLVVAKHDEYTVESHDRILYENTRIGCNVTITIYYNMDDDGNRIIVDTIIRS